MKQEKKNKNFLITNVELIAQCWVEIQNKN